MRGPADRPEPLVVECGAEGYPALLRHLSTPPSPLHIAGSVTRADQAAVAVVGSRTPTPYGIQMAQRIAGGLACRGVTIVSGLARGIDAAAHAAALDGGGRTLAVLGCGLDVDYPRGACALKERIIAAGALVSEFGPGTPPLPGNFPRRNRIISGLSLGVVVVQAGSCSGSLVTARWALDQGREVMAVPGRANEELSAGPIALLREGAAAVADAEDVLRCLGLPNLPEATTEPASSSLLVETLRAGGRTLEELRTLAGCETTELLIELSRLEVGGLVRRDAAGRYVLSR